MSRLLPTRVSHLFGLVVVVLSMLTGVSAASAQGTDATPAPGEEGTAFPAHIHAGTCETLGDVVFPLNDISSGNVGAAPVASPQVMGTAMAEGTAEIVVSGTPVETPMAQGEIVAISETVVDASLDDILGAEHAINVHESAENIQNYIACGDITGEATNGELHIQLQELNGSGYTGEAHLVDNGDGTTTVTVNLMQVSSGTPVASPAA